MQCGIEEKTLKRQKVVGGECFKCGKKVHKCKECLQWKKEEKKGVERVVHVVMPQKMQQQKIRRVEEKRMACMTKPQYHKWLLTICDGCFDTLKSSKI